VKIVSVTVDGESRLGQLTFDQGGGELISLLGVDQDVPRCLQDVFDWDTDQWAANLGPAESMPVGLNAPRFNAPIKGMEKVVCIGTNYADHAREMGGEPPEIPVVFNKFPSTINGPGQEISLPSISQKVDFEAELVVVIGKQGKNISRASALDHVFGYCCGNDISARDWQKGRPGGQWLLGKTFDTFAPIGPMIVTRDEVADPHQLAIQLRLNGETMQSSNTNQLIFPIDFLISHISKFATLKPGDLIFTGTPAGVGAGRSPALFLKPGDELEVEIEGLGILKNSVVAGN
jgi:2-keto-4-pentenoate hydratase/2-oxohepta-3-ene-1,7-dioic acid hydratase in catechol pathway